MNPKSVLMGQGVKGHKDEENKGKDQIHELVGSHQKRALDDDYKIKMLVRAINIAFLARIIAF